MMELCRGLTYTIPAKADELQSKGWLDVNFFNLSLRMPIAEAETLAKRLQPNEYTITIDPTFNKGDLGPGLMVLFFNNQYGSDYFDFDLKGRGVQFTPSSGYTLKPEANTADYSQMEAQLDSWGCRFVHPVDLAKRS